MLKFFRFFFPERSLEERLNPPKTVKVCGMKFKIRKINPLDYINGSNAIQQSYATYEASRQKNAEIKITDADIKKMKSHYSDVILAGVIHPKLSRKDGGEGLFIDKLFTDWGLVEGLYEEIMTHTYGKKKMKQLLSLRKS